MVSEVEVVPLSFCFSFTFISSLSSSLSTSNRHLLAMEGTAGTLAEGGTYGVIKQK
jgi:hypothetical protein